MTILAPSEKTMTNDEFNHIVESLNALSPEQMRQLRREVDE